MSEYCGMRLDISAAGATVHNPCPYRMTKAHLHVGADAACHPSCPADGTDHIHRFPSRDITPAQVRAAIRAEIRAGRLSIRGCRRKLRAFGVTRSDVRAELWNLRPDYMNNDEAAHGPHRVTNQTDPYRMPDPGPP